MIAKPAQGTLRKYSARLLVSVMVLGLLGCATLEPTGSQAANQALQQEIAVGKAALAKIAGTYGVIHDRPATEYLTLYLRSLAQYTERQNLSYQVVILATDQVNAYSLPGGYVCITLGTLKSIHEPGELAGIFAHELGHINLRHILDTVKIQVQPDFWESLAKIIAGNRLIITTALNQINQNIADKLFLEGFGAEHEFAADHYAISLLQSIGIEAKAYRNFLAALNSHSENQSLENLDKTHPPLSSRLQAIDRDIVDGLRVLDHTKEFDQMRESIKTMEASL